MKCILRIVFACVAATFPLKGAEAATRAWNYGAGTTDWFANLNWGNNAPPTSSDIAVIDMTTGPAITATNAASGDLKLGTIAGATGNLTISSGGKLTTTGVGYVGTTSGTTSPSTPGGSGNVTVTGTSSQWAVSGNLILGYGINTAGTLTISAGGQVNAGTIAYIAQGTGSTGSVVVTGAGSKLTTTNQLLVGNVGNGTLSVNSGGQVIAATYSQIGANTGSTGIATVDGTGSLWSSVSDLKIGINGTGTLNISNGGQVTTNSFSQVGLNAGSSGTINISGANSLWSSVGDLKIGLSGTGNLNISSGGKVTTNTFSQVAVNAGSTGIVTVDGTGSLWSTVTDLRIGAGGSGTVHVSNGGEVKTNSYSWVGGAAGSSGTVTVDGVGSRWTAGAEIKVGTIGAGSFTVSNGGKVTSGSFTQLGTNAGGIGTVLVTDVGSQWITATPFSLGYLGTGNLTVSNGAEIKSAGGTFGDSTGGSGNMTVTGAGSKWTNSSTLAVGNVSSGTLVIAGGGLVSNTIGYIGLNAGSTGTVTISGTDSKWQNTDVRVGNNGTGSLTVSNSGKVIATGAGQIGLGAGSTGTVNISGTGSSWTNGSIFSVGVAGTASLNISGGGAVTTVGVMYFGGSPSGVGTATISGTGSSLSSGDLFKIGDQGTGTVTITSGGSASGKALYVGYIHGGTGTLAISGAGSSYSAAGDAYIGGGPARSDTASPTGTGTVSLSNGGKLQAGSGTLYGENTLYSVMSTSTIYIANLAGSVGTLNIGSKSGDAAVGAGVVDAAHVVFGAGAGTITFNHTDTAYHFAASIAGNGTLNFLSGTTIFDGSLNGFTGATNMNGGQAIYNYASGSSIGMALSGSGTLTIASGGTTYLTGNSSAFTGTTTVDDGSILSVNGSLGGQLTVTDGATLKGNGSVGAVTLASGSTIAPGNSIGTLNVATVTFAPGSTYEVEVNRNGTSDRIVASGVATLNGGTVRAIPFPNYAITPYTILTAAGGINGTFDGVTDDMLFVDSALSYDANNVYLTLTRNALRAIDTAGTQNQMASARVLDGTVPGANAAADAFYLLSDVRSAQFALDQLAGEIHADVAGAMLANQNLLENAVLSRDNGNSLEGSQGRLWAKTLRNWRQTAATNGRAGGTSATDQQTTGLLIGAERRWEGEPGFYNTATQLYSGLALGYSHDTVGSDYLSSDADVNSVHALIYGGHRDAGLDLKAGLSGSWHMVSTDRKVIFPGFAGRSQADYDAQSAMLFAETGYDVLNAKDYTVTPYGRASYGLYHANGFTEDGVAGLKGRGTTGTIPSTTLGVHGTQQVFLPTGERLELGGDIGWRHIYGGEAPMARLGLASSPGAGSYRVEGAPLARNSLDLSGTLGFAIDEATSLSLNAATSLAEHVQEQELQARLGWKF